MQICLFRLLTHNVDSLTLGPRRTLSDIRPAIKLIKRQLFCRSTLRVSKDTHPSSCFCRERRLRGKSKAHLLLLTNWSFTSSRVAWKDKTLSRTFEDEAQPLNCAFFAMLTTPRHPMPTIFQKRNAAQCLVVVCLIWTCLLSACGCDGNSVSKPSGGNAGHCLFHFY